MNTLSIIKVSFVTVVFDDRVVAACGEERWFSERLLST